ncbi:N-formylglutamate amidohydrolase [Parasulfitobacter algicola]|uniref:N-formylglutamate amidohydrolase n=1 Tax=Parasulfitobacter algicola TaxID=2614809 RepID=A0ABX2IQ80_9RHOB|nr:N-formylglutamate amidohydrolase [Sulfitobacter algicola]NSX55022.1 N-formylglutamate amidohydrolase [Sulfitobacter algicola]
MIDAPYHILGKDRPGRWLVTCDHATNRVPETVNGGTLGLSDADMERHIAYDVGAAGVTRELARLLNSPAVLSDFSRLVIDPNRGEDDPTLLMKIYDGTIIPGNRHADAVEIEHRLAAYYRPYHAALSEMCERRDDVVIVSVHSFTPALNGHGMRPWQVGILYAHDNRLARPLIARLNEEADLCVGDNEPYAGHLPGDAIDKHALAHNRPNALIELRNDLIKSDDAQKAWAARLAPMLEHALSAAQI